MGWLAAVFVTLARVEPEALVATDRKWLAALENYYQSARYYDRAIAAMERSAQLSGRTRRDASHFGDNCATFREIRWLFGWSAPEGTASTSS